MYTGSALGLISALAFTALLVAACATDVRTRRIPNRLVLVLALSGVASSIAILGAGAGLSRALAGAGVGFAVWMPFHLLRLLGAGDVKLFAASATWLGARGALEAALLAAIVGGVLSLFWMLRVRGVAGSLRSLGIAMSVPSVLMNNHAERHPGGIRMPYGVALAVGAGVIGWLPGLILGD